MSEREKGGHNTKRKKRRLEGKINNKKEGQIDR